MQVPYLSASFGVIYVLVKPSVSTIYSFVISVKFSNFEELFIGRKKYKLNFDYWDSGRYLIVMVFLSMLPLIEFLLCRLLQLFPEQHAQPIRWAEQTEPLFNLFLFWFLTLSNSWVFFLTQLLFWIAYREKYKDL